MTTKKKTTKKPKLVKGPKGKASRTIVFKPAEDKGNNPFVDRNVPDKTETIFEETARADETDSATKKVNDELKAIATLLSDVSLLIRAASCETATTQLKVVAVDRLAAAMGDLNGNVGRARKALTKLEEE